MIETDVKRIREKQGLTQSQLADICGVTLRTVQNWENGKVIPPAMAKLLAAIGEEGFQKEESANNSTTERFLAVLERQQEMMSLQLAEIQKKNEQIDILLGVLKEREQ